MATSDYMNYIVKKFHKIIGGPSTFTLGEAHTIVDRLSEIHTVRNYKMRVKPLSNLPY